MPTKINLVPFVPHGGMTKIASKLGVSLQAVSKALKSGRPGNPAVQEALRMAKESGAIEAAQILATIPQAA
jgi:DNA-binding phage protein